MDFNFTGRVALVTGASKGIGAGIATALGQAGAHVAVGYGHDEAGAQRVVAGIEAAGGHAIAVRGDLTETNDIERMVADTVAAFGPLQILVNNAGFFEYQPLEAITESHVRRILDTNVLGLLMMTKAATARFSDAGGSIINISSLASQGNGKTQSVYAASKAAVNAITKVLALELAERRIRVNAIMPGYYDTEGARSFGIKGTEAEAMLMAATPLAQRAGVPSDLSPVALFLASEGAAWMTGEVLTVSGGLR